VPKRQEIFARQCPRFGKRLCKSVCARRYWLGAGGWPAASENAPVARRAERRIRKDTAYDKQNKIGRCCEVFRYRAVFREQIGMSHQAHWCSPASEPHRWGFPWSNSFWLPLFQRMFRYRRCLIALRVALRHIAHNEGLKGRSLFAVDGSIIIPSVGPVSLSREILRAPARAKTVVRKASARRIAFSARSGRLRSRHRNVIDARAFFFGEIGFSRADVVALPIWEEMGRRGCDALMRLDPALPAGVVSGADGRRAHSLRTARRSSGRSREADSERAGRCFGGCARRKRRKRARRQ